MQIPMPVQVIGLKVREDGIVRSESSQEGSSQGIGHKARYFDNDDSFFFSYSEDIENRLGKWNIEISRKVDTFALSS